MAWPMAKLYPRATENRLVRSTPAVAKIRNAFFKASGKNFLLLQVLFLSLFCWIFGSLYQQETHMHNITIAFVDYDGGAIGKAIREAYSSLQGDRFPSLLEQPVTAFRTPGDLREAVCRIDFWAALYVPQGASAALHAALSGTQAGSYDPSNVLIYIWNEARYPTVADSAISTNLQALSSAARVAYSAFNGTGQVQDLSLTTAASLDILANPWVLTSNNIKPTTQGSRVIYNSVTIILILIQEFFYLGIINGLYVAFKIYHRMHPYRVLLFHLINSLLYTLASSLCTAGAIWAFRSGWDVSGGQFVLSWLILWLFAHLNFQALDVFTVWLPIPYVPMALISWVILNVSSILLPFELSPAFYQIGYIFPAYHVYQVLIDIWSGGCNPTLYYSLPVMFAWWLVTFLLSTVGVFRRCHYATLAEEEQARQLREAEEAKEATRDAQARRDEEESEPGPYGAADKVTTRGSLDSNARSNESRRGLNGQQEELERTPTRAETRLQKELSRTGSVMDCAPAFRLPFGGGGESD